MTNLNDLGNFETAWCPGCGNFGILDALKDALTKLDILQHKIVLVSGIGQAAKLPQYLLCNVFNGLHGRALPAATGIKLANHKLTVIVTSGDGDLYGEGGNHFLHAIRRNIDITVLCHNNQVYGLTKGQASPTSDLGFVTKLQPQGVILSPFNPLSLSVAMDASFVARSFSGDKAHLSEMIQKAILHKGFSLVDILQPCVTFNKKNNFVWYKKRIYKLDENYNPKDRIAAFKKSLEWGDKIPLGVIYTNSRPIMEDEETAIKEMALAEQDISQVNIEEAIKEFI